MKGFAAALLIWTLLSPRRAGGEAWPTHTACRNGNLQVLYQSCADSVDVCLATEKAVLQSSGSSPDPLQDFGFSVDQCARQLKPNINIRFGMVLREDIEQLFLDVALFSKGLSILNFSYPVCEVDLPKFSFCGRRKGEQIYYAGPINNPGFEIPEGDYQVLLELYNQDHATVACANATVLYS
ncbi:lymphocyte antigen 86 isoform X2 [Bos indicus]|nr:lymphocyte antigen 86 isoform X1 [Bos taurus]XP_027380821.1 lymphocyte antigen 86 isoform X2 [Bos indicus x Bos taurus]